MRININDFSIESSSTGLRVSIEVLIDELKPVVAEKSQFEEQDISIMMAFFRIFGLWGL